MLPRWLWMLVMVLSSTACSSTAPAPGEAPQGADRWVSLTPAITETLGRLGALDALVGRSDFCAEPAAVLDRPAVGTSLTPNLEAIVGLRSTAVLIDGSAGTPVDQLAAVGSVEVFPWLTSAEVLESVQRLGTLAGKAAEAEALAGQMREGLAPRVAAGAPRVLVVLGTDGPAGEIWYLKPNSLHGAAIRAAGGINAVGEPVTGAPTLGAEGVLALDPDRIVLVESRELTPAEQEAAVARWAPLSAARAVREQRVSVIGAPGLMSTGPRILDFVRALRAEVGAESSAHP